MENEQGGSRQQKIERKNVAESKEEGNNRRKRLKCIRLQKNTILNIKGKGKGGRTSTHRNFVTLEYHMHYKPHVNV